MMFYSDNSDVIRIVRIAFIMRFITDLHTHSKYSRACSKYLTPENIGAWCERKGIDIVSTADFTHPLWREKLKKSLEPAEKGLYKLKKSSPLSLRGARTRATRQSQTRFLVSTEVSCIYKRHDKTRRVHLCIWMSSLEAAEAFSKKLEDMGKNVASDGRPILGIDSEEILKMVLDIDEHAMVIPAHAWTPWFAIFGSMSGFDSLEECFGENAKHIHAIETGLSSDPPMNWQLSALDNIALVSNSDAHSLEKLGREANVFEFKKRPDYFDITSAIKNRDKKKFLYTIEFFPEEGKYHMDGHRDCKVCLTPKETKRAKNICPKCKKKLTVGVMNRVSSLTQKQKNTKTKKQKDRIPYKSVVPLQEIVAECFGQGFKTKKVVTMYDKLLSECGTEFEILLDKSIGEIKKVGGEMVAEAIKRMRSGDIFVKPGYDGEFGVVKIFDPEEREKMKQDSLL